MVLKESNVLSLVDELDNITYWCKNIVQLYTNDSSFKKDISSFYNSLSGEDQKKLFDKIENISGTVHKMYKILDSIDEEIDLKGGLDESVEYTDTIDAIRNTLERQFPELIVSIVNKPRRAVRVESEKVLDDDNTLFNETFYIFKGSDGRIKAVREHDRPVVFVDVEGVINFFNDYLNS